MEDADSLFAAASKGFEWSLWIFWVGFWCFMLFFITRMCAGDFAKKATKHDKFTTAKKDLEFTTANKTIFCLKAFGSYLLFCFFVSVKMDNRLCSPNFFEFLFVGSTLITFAIWCGFEERDPTD